MKTKNLAIVVMLFFVAGSVFAQGKQGRKGNFNGQDRMGNENKFMNIPDLTDTQKKQLKDLRTAQMKEMLPLKNELKEKQARKNTISTSDNVKTNELNEIIEEIGAIKIQMAKKRAAHRQNIRKLLTDDQRIAFDMNSGRKKGMQKGKKKGKSMKNSR